MAEAANAAPPQYWALDADAVVDALGSRRDGLTLAEAEERAERFGANVLHVERRLSRAAVFVRQVRSPLLLLLVFAASVAAATGEWLDASIVMAIVLATTGIGYSREYRAQTAAAALGARVRVRVKTRRSGQVVTLAAEAVVPGDVILLEAGSLVPADALVLEASDFFVNQAVLTGESFPVQKTSGPIVAAADLTARSNCVFMGTNVRSGTATCVVVATGGATAFGAIADRLARAAPETEFDRGIRRFGYLLTSAMLVLVLVVFAVHVLRHRPPVDTLLFAVALAVGLSPELLPAILSVNLARAAQVMAERGVLVRRLNAIENLGSMTVLCTDKTGTLTEGVIELEGAYDNSGERSPGVLHLAALNAELETGVSSPLDEAISRSAGPAAGGVRKLGEIPFDFVRKRVTVVIEENGVPRLVTKGAVGAVLDICTRLPDGTVLDADLRAVLERRQEAWTARGIRVLALASRPIAAQPTYQRADEVDMTFDGFLTFLDRPKEGVREAIASLAALGVTIKVISGDSRLVVQHVASLIGLEPGLVLTGTQIDELNDDALWHAVGHAGLFVEVDPNQKERIIRALRASGAVVGFLGDGINDAPAMHAADTSLSVEGAVDVAREATDFVLLERGLDVIRRGVEEGRRTFANTMKYVLVTTSANLGNMVSMAAASLVLPFLPLTAGQVLLNNFISDVPAIGIADDRVDPELVDRPRRWDIRFIARYMVEFGILSSIFDVLTFATLMVIFHAGAALFQTTWFVESLLTELVVALVMRTRRPFYRSRPGRLLLLSTLALIPLAFAIPYLPGAAAFGFVPLPATLVLAIAAITVAYVIATELQKKWFYAREHA